LCLLALVHEQSEGALPRNSLSFWSGRTVCEILSYLGTIHHVQG
jgi:hypothetical protein